MARYYIRPNHSRALPRNIVTVDCETLPTVSSNNDSIKYHHFRLGVASFGRWIDNDLKRRQTKKFKDPQAFWSWFYGKLHHRSTTWLIAHNAGFDATALGLWQELDSGRLCFDIPRKKRDKPADSDPDHPFGPALCVTEDPPTIVGLRHESGGRFVLIDTMNYFRCSVRKLGEWLGLPKEPMPAFEDSDLAWLYYCERDVQITEAAFVQLIRFSRKHDLGMFRYTGASMSMSAFRHGRMEHQILPHDDMDVRKLERASYFGGRTQVFQFGRVVAPLFQLDVNSLFPSVMFGNIYPIKLLASRVVPGFVDHQPFTHADKSIAEVQLLATEESFPVRLGTRVHYSAGQYVTTLAGPELVRAIELGCVLRFGRWATYECERIFDRFVTEFWKLKQHYREQGDDVRQAFTKLILNGLYGKFGQRAPKWELQPNEYAPQRWGRGLTYDCTTKTATKERYMAGKVLKHNGDGEMKRSCPAISSFVTSYARLRMNELRRTARGHNVFYQAVDSLIVNRAGLIMLEQTGEVVDDALGKLRLEDTAESAHFVAPNQYIFGDKRVSAGRKKTAVEGTNGQWTEQQFEGLASVLAEGPQDFIREQKVTKTWHAS